MKISERLPRPGEIVKIDSEWVYLSDGSVFPRKTYESLPAEYKDGKWLFFEMPLKDK